MSIVTGAILFLIYCVSFVLGQGDGPITRIVGGRVANPGQFPYQVSLQMRGQHFCGGSIVSSSRILTAAHCMEIAFRPSDIDIIVGTIGLRYTSGALYRTKRVRIHPDYDPRTVVSDIATLDTDRIILFNKNVQPIALATSSPFPGRPVTASGWGLLQYQGSMPDQLQYVNLEIIDNERCAFIHRGGRFIVNDGNLCTTSPQGQGVCSGDSGGPLTFEGEQVGVVSWVAPCALGVPDVFASVAAHAHRQFILQK